MIAKKGKQCTRLQMREMAVAATVDDRTMRKYLRGEPVSPISKERIERSLVKAKTTEARR